MLGPYEVDVLLGAGGMGEVYRARDTRLGRTVAIKVLLSGLTAGSERRARFEREARAISALSNPHICGLYDIGREGDTEYLVMEYIEGETLADRIARGRLPLSQVLRYGTEIAQALQHAHRAGITHRDLKPGNVMITSSGIKLLDFGLAKLAGPDGNSSNAADALTLVNPITAEGMIVGTVVYMSPEQIEGRAVDHRTDIFALGCILYEMTTGQRPFGGSSHVSIASAILSSDPAPVRSLEPSAPAALERIILTALEKNPDDRWQTAQDVARQLRWLSEPSTSAEERIPRPSPRASRRLLIALPIAAAIGGLLAWGAGRLFYGRRGAPAAIRLHLATPEDIQYEPSFEFPNFAVSPDGRTLCFVGRQGPTQALFLRALDSFDVRKVEGSDDASSPFWSLDGAWIGYNAHGKLWKTRMGSNTVPEALCEISGGGAVGSWVGKTILFADGSSGRNEIFRISDSGGTPVKVSPLKRGEWRQTWPRLLPDERHFLYQSADLSLDRKLILASLDSPESSVLLKNVSGAALVAADQLAYVRDGKLLVQRFDAGKGVMIGAPSLIANDVSYFYPSGRGAFDAANGTIVYRTDTSTGRLVMTDRKGSSRIIDDHGPFQFLGLSYSGDGKRAAVTVLDRATGLGDIWIYDLARAVRDRITNEPGLALTPIWSRDGRSIIYSQAAAGSLPRLARRGLTSPASEYLMPPGGFQFAGSFSEDGSALFFSRSSPKTKTDILKLDMRTQKAEPLIATSFDESDPQASPDGKWLAFSSDATGVGEIYLQSLIDPAAPRVRVSAAGGYTPRWRADGGELFYVSSQNDVMSVVPRVPGQWAETTSTALFRQPANALRFDASPDGQSFLFIEGSHGAADGFFHVITGWQ
jgi:Tol biopolymer transport system component/predicted Ser/Thr protein kinase